MNPKPTRTPSDSHGAAVPAESKGNTPQTGAEKTSSLPLYSSIAALVAILVSLVVSLKKKA